MKTEQKVTCGGCGRVWVPDFSIDCYEIDGVELCEPCAMPYMMKSRSPEPVDEQRAKGICKLGQKEVTCTFLVMSPRFACAKYSGFENILRKRMQEGLMGAKSDNCSGPPAFKVPNS